MKLRLVTSGLLVLALGALVLVWSSWTVRETRQTAISELQLATERGAGQIANALRALELVMRTASVHVAATGTIEGLQPYLKQLTARLPPIRTVTVISPDGEIRTDLRDGEPAKGYQVGDRAYFQAHFPPQAVTDYFYSPPIKSRLDGLTQITLSLAARGGNNDLIAVVVSSIDDRFFAALSQELQAVGLYDARVLYKDGRDAYVLHELAPAGAGHGFIVDTMARLFVGSETVHRERIAIPYSDLRFQLSLPVASYMTQAAPLVVRGSLFIGLIILLLAMVMWLAHRGRAQLMESEGRFRRLFENAGISIWNEDFSDVIEALDRLRRDGVGDLRQYLDENEDAALGMAAMIKVTHVNQATLKLFGAKSEEAFIESIDKVFGPDALDVFIDELCAIWAKEKTYRAEVAHRTLDGEELTVIISMPIPETKEGFRSVPVSILDITERKRAEEIVKLSESRFRSAFQNLATGNIVIDDAGVIEIFNLSAEEIFGYSADEVIGRNVSMLMPEPDRGRHGGFIRNYLNSGVPKIIGIGREVTGLRKNGETFPMQLGVGEMKTGGGSSFVSSISDLTEIKALEARLVQSQKLEAVGLLTGGVAHDFNNLMAIMMGNAELLEKMLGDNPEASGYIEDIIQAVERGSSLTQRLLAFSRKQILSPKETDVNQLVLSLEDMLSRTLGEMVELKVMIGQDTCLAMIDPSQLEMVMINLAVNAKDAMPQGGLLMIETTTVTLDEAYTSQREDVEPGDYVEVAVSDTGTGMPPEILEHVFEPFFTTKDVGQGSGLGLSMVFGFAKQSKGHASIYSEVGKGTTVKVFLPCATSGKSDAAAKEAATSESERGHERILVVEDDESVRNIPSAMLRAHGYEVVEVMNGAQAMEILKNEKPFDLLFTDVVLPGGMNGVEISEQARQLQPNIKTLYTTGYTENTVIHSGELDPGVTLVSKPYRRQELLDKVRAMLDSED